MIPFFFHHFAEKERELGVAHGEIKSLRATETLKDKAVEEVPKKFLPTYYIHLSFTYTKLSIMTLKLCLKLVFLCCYFLSSSRTRLKKWMKKSLSLKIFLSTR